MLILTVAISFLSAFLLSRAMFAYGSRYLVDIPNGRSSHTIPTPRGGGVAIVVTCLAAAAYGAQTGLIAGHVASAAMLAGLLVAGVGLWDDHRSLSPIVRLLLQACAAVGVLYVVGVAATVDLGFAVVAVPFSLACVLMWVWIVGLINVVNFMDGIDGIATSECVFVMLAGGALSLVDGQGDLAYVCFATAGAGLGFLMWNLPPARIFMGDVGSGYLGLIFGLVSAVQIARDPSRVWVWTILLMAFLADAGVTLIRRLLAGEAVWQPHRTHAYQHAARKWGHASTTTGFTLVNVLWLGPLAACAQIWPQLGATLCAAAALPLLLTAWRFGAGTAAGLPTINPPDQKQYAPDEATRHRWRPRFTAG